MIYYEFCEGITNRNNFFTIKEIKEKEKKTNLEYYISMFGIESDTRPTDIKLKTNNFVLERIIFDIDYSVNHITTLEITRKFAVKLVINIGIEQDNIKIFFSGKGFHIHIPNVFNLNSKNIKQAVNQHFPEVDNIYDTSRIIRYPNSINYKTGLYKIPLTWEELFDDKIDILKLATKTRVVEFPQEIQQHIELDIIEEKKVLKPFEPTPVITCIQKIWMEGPLEGSRHHKMLRIASAYRRQGITKDGILALLLEWSKGDIPYNEVVSIVENTFKTGYQYSCNDKIMSKYCDSKCIFYKNKNFVTKILTSKEMEDDYIKYINSELENKSINFKNVFNTNDFRIEPGEFVMLIGDTGSGKTTFLQNLCIKLDYMPVLYLSLEVNANLLFRKFIQIAHNLTKEQVINYYKVNKNNLSDAIKHIKVMTSSPDILSIQRLIVEHQPKLLCIDVMDQISVGEYSDSLVKMEKIANELRELAQRHSMIIFGIHHIDKQSAKEKTLTVHSGKGATAMQQKTDKVLGISKHMENPNSSIRLISTLKSRDENPIEFEITWNFETHKMRKV